MASFNIPCPSCENNVLIKSDALIGKKVECPKCKYRFKVEDPSDEGDGMAPKKKKGDAKKKGKKGKSGSGMLIGGLLGVLALGLLAVAGYFLFFNEKEGTSKGGTTTPPANTSSGSTGSKPDSATPDSGTKPPEDGANNPGEHPGNAKSTGGEKDVTNLLPGETNAVYRVNMNRLAQTPLFGAFFDRNSLDFFKNSMTFEVGDIETYIHCIVGPDRYNYDIFRMKKPLDEITLLRRLDQVPGPEGKIKGYYYGTLKSNAFVDSLGRALSTQALFGEAGLPVTAEDKKRWGENKPTAYCLFDPYTLIVAEQSTLERFLYDLTPSGYPPYRTDLTSPDAASPEEITTPGGPDGPGEGPGRGAAPPGGGGRRGGSSLLEKDKNGYALTGQGRSPQPPGGGGGRGGRGGPGGGGLQPRSPGTGPGGPQPQAPGTGPGGGGLQPMSPGAGGPGGGGGRRGAGPGGRSQGGARRKNYTSIPTYRTIDESIKAMLNQLEEDDRNPPIAVYAEKLDRHIQLLNQRFLAYQSTAYEGYDIGAFAAILQNANVVGASIDAFARDKFKANISFAYNTAGDAKNSAEQHILPILNTYKLIFEFFLGTQIDIRGGANTTIVPGNPGGAGPGGGVGPGGDPVTGPGGGRRQAGPPPGGDFGGTPDNAPGGSGGRRGSGFPGSGRQQGGDSNAQSFINVALADKSVLIGLEFLWNEEKYKNNVYAIIQSVAKQLKGRMAVLSGQTTWHDLASAFPSMTAKKKPFPRGTIARDARPERFGMPFPPEQRASFFVELLPFIGKGELHRKVQDKKFPWYAKENRQAAQEWVPEFLVPYYPQSSWRAFSPLADNVVFGATNFVGLAGLGLDAGRYDPANPEQAKKVGITGYSWGSKPEEITDGLSNTIYLIQVKPGGLQRPWIAGGGATVVGVDDKAANPIEDFASTTPDNKRGTYVLMADGSVRWVNDTIDKNVFMGMVTRAGGESLADLEAKAPKVAGKKKEVEIKGAGGQAPLPGSAGGDARPEETKVDADEAKRFQGDWKVTFLVMEGRKITGDDLAKLNMSISIDGNTVKITALGVPQTSTITRLDGKKKPREMDSVDTDGPDKGKVEFAVYEFVGEHKIKIRFAKPGSPRPKDVQIPQDGSTDNYVEIEN